MKRQQLFSSDGKLLVSEPQAKPVLTARSWSFQAILSFPLYEIVTLDMSAEEMSDLMTLRAVGGKLDVLMKYFREELVQQEIFERAWVNCYSQGHPELHASAPLIATMIERQNHRLTVFKDRVSKCLEELGKRVEPLKNYIHTHSEIKRIFAMASTSIPQNLAKDNNLLHGFEESLLRHLRALLVGQDPFALPVSYSSTATSLNPAEMPELTLPLTRKNAYQNSQSPNAPSGSSQFPASLEESNEGQIAIGEVRWQFPCSQDLESYHQPCQPLLQPNPTGGSSAESNDRHRMDVDGPVPYHQPTDDHYEPGFGFEGDGSKGHRGDDDDGEDSDRSQQDSLSSQAMTPQTLGTGKALSKSAKKRFKRRSKQADTKKRRFDDSGRYTQ